MFGLSPILKYSIVSDSLVDKACAPKDHVYKIYVNTRTLQIPQFRLFTHNPKLVKHLENFGFFLTSNLLVSHAVSYIGQLAANELLIRFDLQANLSNQKDKTKAKQLKIKIAKSTLRSQWIHTLQQQISELQQEEQKISKDNLSQQARFKLKLTLLLQNTIYKLRANSSNCNGIINNLNQTINLIDNYQFPDSYVSDAKINILDKKKLYNINPNLLGRIDSHHNVLKLYLALNSFSDKHSSVKIKAKELANISRERKKYASRFSVNSINKYIRHHPFRTMFFGICIILECLFLPGLAPRLAAYKIFTFFGLHRLFMLLPFCVSYTFYSINKLCDIPKFLGSAYHKIISWFKTTKYSRQSKVAATHSYAHFERHLKSSIELHPHGTQSFRTKNFLMSIPILSNIINFTIEEYKNYSNWYFSYIQRNPISLLIYLIVRTFGFLLNAVMPLSNIIYCTYLDIDRSITLESIKTENPSNSCALHNHDQQPQENKSEPSSISAKFKSFINCGLNAIPEVVLSLFIKIPLGLAFIFSKMVLSCTYLTIYLIFNFAIETFKILNYKPIHNYLLQIEHSVTNFYYLAYYAYSYQFEHLNKSIDNHFFRKSAVANSTPALVLASQSIIYRTPIVPAVKNAPSTASTPIASRKFSIR